MGGWEIAGSGFNDHGSTGTVFFISAARPGVWLSVTLLLDGTETVTGFELRQQTPEERAETPIGARLIRSVPVGLLAHAAMLELRDRANRALDFESQSEDPVSWEQAMLRSLSLVSVPMGHKRPGRRGHPDQYYAQLAVEYEAWLQTDTPLATWAAQKSLSESALRAAVGTARRKALLTKAPPGRKGGTATEKAKVILRAAAQRPG